jgi:hypothetical protein
MKTVGTLVVGVMASFVDTDMTVVVERNLAKLFA